MTISWGSMGTIWGQPANGRPIVTVYVNPLRYTYRILNNSNHFTVSFFAKEHLLDLLIMGSHSGRDTDKVSLTNLTPVTGHGFVTYKEALYTFECNKLYQQTLDKNALPKKIADMFYAPGEEAHRMYIGEFVRILEGGRD